MILYYDDWINKHPTAIIDTNTKNRTWVRYAHYLKEKGVKNYAFCLALHNPELVGVDPFDPDLDIYTQAKIVIECKTNPWYFFREIFRIPIVGVDNGAMLKGNRLNIAYLWCSFNHITTYSMAPRQMGKSLVMNGMTIYIECIAVQGLILPILTKDNKLRVKTINDIKGHISLLPPYLNPRDRKDNNVSDSVTIKNLKNKIITDIAKPSPIDSLNTLRGHSLPVTMIDEFNFYLNNKEALTSIVPAEHKIREILKERERNLGESHIYFTSYFTTAGYLNTKHGHFGYKVYTSGFRWQELVYDAKDYKDLGRILRTNLSPVKEDEESDNGLGDMTHDENFMPMIVLEFNHRQLGEDDNWLLARRRETMNTMSDEVFAAEYMNKFLIGNQNSPISAEIRNMMDDSIIEPYVKKYVPYDFLVRWYVEDEQELQEMLQDEDYPVIIAVDSSENIGKDFTAIVFLNSRDGSTLGCCELNYANTIDIGIWLCKEFLIKYPCILIPEARSLGVALIEICIKILHESRIDPFFKIYNTAVSGNKRDDDYEDSMRDIPLMARDYNDYLFFKDRFGFKTAGAGQHARSALYDTTFKEMLRYLPKSLYDANLVKQYLGLVVKNGRIDHTIKGHDDLVIAHLLAFWFLLYGVSKEEYGVYDYNCLSEMERVNKVQEDIQPKTDKDKVGKLINSQILDLLDTATETRHPTQKNQLLKQIAMLASRFDVDLGSLGDINTRDELIEHIIKERKLKRKINSLR